MPAVVIVGAGPGGLATAASLRKVGVEARLLDAEGRVGGAYDRLYPEMPLASPWSMNRLPHDRTMKPVPALTAGVYAEYLRAYAEHHQLAVEKARVLEITRGSDGAFQLKTEEGALAADFVIVATGTYSHPVQPSIPGTPDLHQVHSAQFRHSEMFQGSRVLIVGSGMSAFELGNQLMDVAGRIDLSVRRYRAPFPTKRLGVELLYLVRPLEWVSQYTYKSMCAWHPPANDKSLVAWIKSGRVRVLAPPIRIDGHTVGFADETRDDFDVIIWATGYRYETAFLPDSISANWKAVKRCESRSWPNLFFVGFPCVRSSASAFIRGISEDARLVARRVAKSSGATRTS